MLDAFVSSCIVMQDPAKATEQFVAALSIWLEKEDSAYPRDDSCEAIDIDNSPKAPDAGFAVTFQRFLDLILFSLIELQLEDNDATELVLSGDLTAVCFIYAIPCR
jgi:hypothetical protein